MALTFPKSLSYAIGVNIRLSTGDLQDIQIKALEEGMPYQTLIASILHKYVTGRLAEREVTPNEPKAAAKPSKARSA